MQQSERTIRILKMLQARHVISRAEFLSTLEISPATFKRDIAYLRDRLNAPIEWSAEHHGYRLLATNSLPDAREPLPGLWLDAHELVALLAIEQLLQQIEPRVLGDALYPIRKRTEQLLQGSTGTGEARTQALRRIRVLPMHRRAVDGATFQLVTEALLGRKQLAVTSTRRTSGAQTVRVLSPQRLVSYRDNWYLDAWCHLRNELRTFALDTLTKMSILVDVAEDIDDAVLDEQLSRGYGIFSGPVTAVAVLRFTHHVSGWVEREIWHPDQKLRRVEDGGVVLEIPYADPTELIRDILKWGADVEVLAPHSLRDLVGNQVQRLQAMYF